MTNLYSPFFESAEPADASPAHAALDAVNAYLDGKPTGSRVTIGRAERDADFWSCPHWPSVPIDTWRSSAMTLALSSYFAQEDTSNPDLLESNPPAADAGAGRLGDDFVELAGA